MDHTPFLWGSYAFTAIVLVIEVGLLVLRRKNARFSGKISQKEAEND